MKLCRLERELYLRRSFAAAPLTAVADTLITIKFQHSSVSESVSEAPKWAKGTLDSVVAFAVKYKLQDASASELQLCYYLSTALAQRHAMGMKDHRVLGATCVGSIFTIYGAEWAEPVRHSNWPYSSMIKHHSSLFFA
jgi:hypothetical protein